MNNIPVYKTSDFAGLSNGDIQKRILIDSINMYLKEQGSAIGSGTDDPFKRDLDFAESKNYPYETICNNFGMICQTYAMPDDVQRIVEHPFIRDLVELRSPDLKVSDTKIFFEDVHTLAYSHFPESVFSKEDIVGFNKTAKYEEIIKKIPELEAESGNNDQSILNILMNSEVPRGMIPEKYLAGFDSAINQKTQGKTASVEPSSEVATQQEPPSTTVSEAESNKSTEADDLADFFNSEPYQAPKDTSSEASNGEATLAEPSATGGQPTGGSNNPQSGAGGINAASSLTTDSTQPAAKTAPASKNASEIDTTTANKEPAGDKTKLVDPKSPAAAELAKKKSNQQQHQSMGGGGSSLFNFGSMSKKDPISNFVKNQTKELKKSAQTIDSLYKSITNPSASQRTIDKNSALLSKELIKAKQLTSAADYAFDSGELSTVQAIELGSAVESLNEPVSKVGNDLDSPNPNPLKNAMADDKNASELTKAILELIKKLFKGMSKNKEADSAAPSGP